MPAKYAEPLFYAPIAGLGFSRDFCIFCEVGGYHTIADLLERHTSELLKRPGFTYHLLQEYISFMEKNRVGHYLDTY